MRQVDNKVRVYLKSVETLFRHWFRLASLELFRDEVSELSLTLNWRASCFSCCMLGLQACITTAASARKLVV